MECILKIAEEWPTQHLLTSQCQTSRSQNLTRKCTASPTVPTRCAAVTLSRSARNKGDVTIKCNKSNNNEPAQGP